MSKYTLCSSSSSEVGEIKKRKKADKQSTNSHNKKENNGDIGDRYNKERDIGEEKQTFLQIDEVNNDGKSRVSSEIESLNNNKNNDDEFYENYGLGNKNLNFKFGEHDDNKTIDKKSLSCFDENVYLNLDVDDSINNNEKFKQGSNYTNSDNNNLVCDVKNRLTDTVNFISNNSIISSNHNENKKSKIMNKDNSDKINVLCDKKIASSKGDVLNTINDTANIVKNLNEVYNEIYGNGIDNINKSDTVKKNVDEVNKRIEFEKSDGLNFKKDIDNIYEVYNEIAVNKNSINNTDITEKNNYEVKNENLADKNKDFNSFYKNYKIKNDIEIDNENTVNENKVVNSFDITNAVNKNDSSPDIKFIKQHNDCKNEVFKGKEDDKVNTTANYDKVTNSCHANKNGKTFSNFKAKNDKNITKKNIPLISDHLTNNKKENLSSKEKLTEIKPFELKSKQIYINIGESFGEWVPDIIVETTNQMTNVKSGEIPGINFDKNKNLFKTSLMDYMDEEKIISKTKLLQKNNPLNKNLNENLLKVVELKHEFNDLNIQPKNKEINHKKFDDLNTELSEKDKKEVNKKSYESNKETYKKGSKEMNYKNNNFIETLNNDEKNIKSDNLNNKTSEKDKNAVLLKNNNFDIDLMENEIYFKNDNLNLESNEKDINLENKDKCLKRFKSEPNDKSENLNERFYGILNKDICNVINNKQESGENEVKENILTQEEDNIGKKLNYINERKENNKNISIDNNNNIKSIKSDQKNLSVSENPDFMNNFMDSTYSRFLYMNGTYIGKNNLVQLDDFPLPGQPTLHREFLIKSVMKQKPFIHTKAFFTNFYGNYIKSLINEKLNLYSSNNDEASNENKMNQENSNVIEKMRIESDTKNDNYSFTLGNQTICEKELQFSATKLDIIANLDFKEENDFICKSKKVKSGIEKQKMELLFTIKTISESNISTQYNLKFKEIIEKIYKKHITDFRKIKEKIKQVLNERKDNFENYTYVVFKDSAANFMLLDGFYAFFNVTEDFDKSRVIFLEESMSNTYNYKNANDLYIDFIISSNENNEWRVFKKGEVIYAVFSTSVFCYDNKNFRMYGNIDVNESCLGLMEKEQIKIAEKIGNQKINTETFEDIEMAKCGSYVYKNGKFSKLTLNIVRDDFQYKGLCLKDFTNRYFKN